MFHTATLFKAASKATGTALAALATVLPNVQAEPARAPSVSTSDVAQSEAAAFSGLGDLPGGEFSSKAAGISSDGKVVVGWSRSQNGKEAYRWTHKEGMVGLGDLDGGDFSSVAAAASADGSVVVGIGAVDGLSPQRAFRWTGKQGLVALSDHQSAVPREAVDVSSDGTRIAGTLELRNSDTKAFTWTENDGYETLDSKITMSYRTFDAITDVFAISGDGRIAVGYVKFNEIDFVQACLWVDGQGAPLRRPEFNEGVPSYMADFIGTRTVCVDIAKDCVAVVGRYENKQRLGTRGFHVADGKLTWLESPDVRLTWPQAVSGDGKTVVGQGADRSGKEIGACIWRAEFGVRPLADHLANIGGKANEWKLTDATNVSGDGCVIVGNGINPDGRDEAWILRLPR